MRNISENLLLTAVKTEGRCDDCDQVWRALSSFAGICGKSFADSVTAVGERERGRGGERGGGGQLRQQQVPSNEHQSSITSDEQFLRHCSSGFALSRPGVSFLKQS